MRFLMISAVAAMLQLPVMGVLQAADPMTADDQSALDSRLSHVAGDMPEPYAVVLIVAGLVASLILIRGPALRRAGESVKRIPGDAP
jgi:hypothetical protein